MFVIIIITIFFQPSLLLQGKFAVVPPLLLGLIGGLGHDQQLEVTAVILLMIVLACILHALTGRY